MRVMHVANAGDGGVWNQVRQMGKLVHSSVASLAYAGMTSYPPGASER